VRMHKYLLCTILAVVVSTSDPKNLVVDHVYSTKHIADIGRLS
jgi:hypothetical protein